jgi:hypothetical protein
VKIAENNEPGIPGKDKLPALAAEVFVKHGVQNLVHPFAKFPFGPSIGGKKENSKTRKRVKRGG